MAAIYALTNRDGEIRYSGKANDPAARLKSHMRDAQHPKKLRMAQAVCK